MCHRTMDGRVQNSGGCARAEGWTSLGTRRAPARTERPRAKPHHIRGTHACTIGGSTTGQACKDKDLHLLLQMRVLLCHLAHGMHEAVALSTVHCAVSGVDV